MFASQDKLEKAIPTHIAARMKVDSAVALLAILCISITDAWTPLAINQPSGTCLAMASRGTEKWARKQAWLTKRGFDASLAANAEATAVPKSITIVGSGRIGGLLAQVGESVVVGREDTIDPNGSGPILLTTRNDVLADIVQKCPENRRKDLVFMQNGYLDNFLESMDLKENTQALLYLAVTAKGAEPIDGVTSFNPEGLTAATGEHAQLFADRLAALNLKCNVVSAQEYRPAMFEKLMYVVNAQCGDIW